MGEKNKDRRVVRTKKAIRSTFEQMIIGMEYPDITIKELTLRAGINRKTFYLHYASLEELFDELRDELIEKLTRVVDGPAEDKDEVRLEQMLARFHGAVMENPPLHEKLMFGSSYQFFFSSVNAALMKKWLSAQLPEPAGGEEFGIIFDFISAGILAGYKSWFERKTAMAPEMRFDVLVRQIRFGLSGMMLADVSWMKTKGGRPCPCNQHVTLLFNPYQYIIIDFFPCLSRLKPRGGRLRRASG